MGATRIFLLSPARCDGKRAQLLIGERARSALAMRLRGGAGVRLGEAFSFLSGLYFRGKLAYAMQFASPPAGSQGAYVITTDRGLVPATQRIGLEDLRQMADSRIDLSENAYRIPLEQGVRRLASAAGADCEWVLLGSIASGKYIDVLHEVLGERLKFPAEFVGRGDMSRGGLMLRCVQDRRELSYIPVAGAIRNGNRPPKLLPRPGILAGAVDVST